MKRVLAIVVAIILSMGMGASIAAQVDEEDCMPLPNLDSITKCDGGFFRVTDPNGTDFDLVLVHRVEYKSEKIADATFDEMKEMSESPKDETDTPLKPTKDYKRLGISDAIQSKDDESIVVMLRDDKAIIVVVGTINNDLFDDDLLDDLITTVVEEDEIPEEIEGLETFGQIES